MGGIQRVLVAGVAPIQVASPLSTTAWCILAGVPVGIIALYFLKLRRRPVRVSSTLLWKRSLEEVRVNSLFQRLKRNLLLFLQLLTVGLAMLALLGIRFDSAPGGGRRFVLMIDQSASMGATDIKPSRLEKAKSLAREVVRGMNAADLGMVIAFADRAQVISPYTGDRRMLLERIDAIEQTEARTSLRDALEVAAGLANPLKQVDDRKPGSALPAPSSPAPPRLYIYTDGGFSDVEEFSLGNLDPEVVVIGPGPPPYRPADATKDGAPRPLSRPSDNVAILALEARTGDDKPDLHQLFGRVRNFRAEVASIEAELYRSTTPAESTLIDAIALELPAQGEQSFKFDLPESAATAYEVRLKVEDALPLDNHAYAVVGANRKSQVLVITPGNRYLLDALKTPAVASRAEIAVINPEQARGEQALRDLRGGRYDLVILDGVQPPVAPEASTLSFGAFPLGPAFANPREVATPIILDSDVAHPLLQYLRDLPLVYVAHGRAVDLPPGAHILIEGDKGPMAFTVTREGYTDAVVTFPLLTGDVPNTTWFRYISFPLFIMNAINTLGHAHEGSGETVAEPGRPYAIHAQTSEKSIDVTPPRGQAAEAVPRSTQGTYVYAHADRTGIYRATWPPDQSLPFAVNLFDLRESDLSTRGIVPDGTPRDLVESYKIKVGYNTVTGVEKPPQVKQDLWKTFALLVLGVLLVEWFVYNRRVFV